ncbi:hypothetical protein C9890_0493 [Perkinsus sp. BL_2016]|nr:hypothetical protein C9890_0493 [Perkinsus sp. BL_2016]
MLNFSLISVVAAAAIQSTSGRVQKQCTNEAQSLLLIRDGLEDFKKLNKKAGSGKLTFIAGTDDLPEKAKNVVKKYGKWSVVWELDRDELRDARKLRKKSKKLKKTIKKMIKTYKKSTGKELKMVILPSSTSKRIVKAFEKRGIRVIKPDTTLSKSSKVRKFMKKVRKAQKKNTSVGKIVSYQVSDKLDAKKLKKLRRALSVVTAKKCFNVEIKEKKEEAHSGINLNSDINNKSKSSSQYVDNNSGSDLEHVVSEGDLFCPFSAAALVQPISAGALAQPESEDDGVDHVSEDVNVVSEGNLVQSESEGPVESNYEGDNFDFISEGALVQPDSEHNLFVSESEGDNDVLESEVDLAEPVADEGNIVNPVSDDSNADHECENVDSESEVESVGDNVDSEFEYDIVESESEVDNVDPESEGNTAVVTSFIPVTDPITPAILSIIVPVVNPFEPFVFSLRDNVDLTDTPQNLCIRSDQDNVVLSPVESEDENPEDGSGEIESVPINFSLSENDTDIILPVESYHDSKVGTSYSAEKDSMRFLIYAMLSCFCMIFALASSSTLSVPETRSSFIREYVDSGTDVTIIYRTSRLYSTVIEMHYTASFIIESDRIEDSTLVKSVRNNQAEQSLVVNLSESFLAMREPIPTRVQMLQRNFQDITEMPLKYVLISVLGNNPSKLQEYVDAFEQAGVVVFSNRVLVDSASPDVFGPMNFIDFDSFNSTERKNLAKQLKKLRKESRVKPMGLDEFVGRYSRVSRRAIESSRSERAVTASTIHQGTSSATMNQGMYFSGNSGTNRHGHVEVSAGNGISSCPMERSIRTNPSDRYSRIEPIRAVLAPSNPVLTRCRIEGSFLVLFRGIEHYQMIIRHFNRAVFLVTFHEMKC